MLICHPYKWLILCFIMFQVSINTHTQAKVIINTKEFKSVTIGIAWLRWNELTGESPKPTIKRKGHFRLKHSLNSQTITKTECLKWWHNRNVAYCAINYDIWHNVIINELIEIVPYKSRNIEILSDFDGIVTMNLPWYIDADERVFLSVL